MHYLDRPMKILKRPPYMGGDVTIAAAATFATGTGLGFVHTLDKDSLLEVIFSGNLTVAGALGNVALDIAIDGRLVGFDALPAGPAGTNGAANGLGTQTVSVVGDLHPFRASVLVDSLAAGPHTIALYMKTTGAGSSGVIKAAAASTALACEVREHASIFPPST